MHHHRNHQHRVKKKYNYWYYYYNVTYNNSTSNHYIFDFCFNTFGSSGWQCSIAGDCDDDGYMVSSTAEVSMGSKCRCIDTATPEVSMRKGMIARALTVLVCVAGHFAIEIVSPLTQFLRRM